MFEKYPKIENMIRSYFNQDTVAEIGSTDISSIIDIYLSEVPKDGVKQLFNEIVQLLNENKQTEINQRFQEHFKGYVYVTPVDDLFKMLQLKFVDKYPNPSTKIVQRVRTGRYIIDGWGRVSIRRTGRRKRVNVEVTHEEEILPMVASAHPRAKIISQQKKRILRRKLIRKQIIQAIDEPSYSLTGDYQKKLKA